MDSIAPFINLGWNTVPLKGSLQRQADGSKTVPKFEKNWKAKYATHTNTIASRIGGAMTGLPSGIIAIDCDNSLTWSLFRALDPDYDFVFMSKGKKDYTCGTIIYAYDETFADSFSINDGTLALDFYSNSGFIYLPTAANTSKEAWSGRLPKLKPAPEATLVLLDRLRSPTATPVVEQSTTNIMTASCLAPLVKQFTQERSFMPGLFKILTPKTFRNTPQYVEHGFMHPKNIPEGRGSEYLSKVSAILGSDVSIDEALYCATMHDINDLWTEPMDADRLDATIIDPMINSKASIDGRPIWQYDENWAKYRFILHTKRQSSIELGFDDRRNMYYCVDAANEHIQSFNRDNDYMSYLGSIAVDPPKKLDMKTALPMINVTSEPQKPFGFFADTDPTARTLNTFIRTPELAIIDDPESYAAMYKKPETILRFLEALVPEDHMREFLLKFLRRKLTTFEYSPVVLYFLGVHGSGKDTFVALLEKIMGKVARPTTREFLEMFNGWLLDSYFVQMDEYGNQLTTMRDREEAVGKLKAYTGKQNVQVRQMRTDGFMYKHNATFISTANTNPLGLEDGDRRIALFNTPNVLIEEDWVDDVAEVHKQILSESKDFCYYLATQVDGMSGSAYTKPPESKDKQELIADSMHAAAKIAYVLKHGMGDYLKDLAFDYGITGVAKDLKNGMLWSATLEELYDNMTDFHGQARSLNKAVRGAGIDMGRKDDKYYYKLSWLGKGVASAGHSHNPFKGE